MEKILVGTMCLRKFEPNENITKLLEKLIHDEKLMDYFQVPKAYRTMESLDRIARNIRKENGFFCDYDYRESFSDYLIQMLPKELQKLGDQVSQIYLEKKRKEYKAHVQKAEQVRANWQEFLERKRQELQSLEYAALKS